MNELEGGGTHELEVIAEDQVGNKRPEKIEFEYFPATGMKDEYVMQHFPLPDGEGMKPKKSTQAARTRRQRDERQPRLPPEGRRRRKPSVNLEVERYYNSELPD